MFSFGKNKTEARITGEFYINAIHVMEGATALSSGKKPRCRSPQAGPAAKDRRIHRARKLRRAAASEAFRIEYWALEEAKIRRQPPEKELSRRIALVVGGGNGIGRATALARGASVARTS